MTELEAANEAIILLVRLTLELQLTDSPQTDSKPGRFMSSPAITTVITMMEFLPAALQEQVAEHLREYIADLQDEQRWDASFNRTQDNLIAAARRARQEIEEGKATPLDYEQL